MSGPNIGLVFYLSVLENPWLFDLCLSLAMKHSKVLCYNAIMANFPVLIPEEDGWYSLESRKQIFFDININTMKPCSANLKGKWKIEYYL